MQCASGDYVVDRVAVSGVAHPAGVDVGHLHRWRVAALERVGRVAGDDPLGVFALVVSPLKHQSPKFRTLRHLNHPMGLAVAYAAAG